MSASLVNCVSCIFWSPVERDRRNSAFGDCRRHAPVADLSFKAGPKCIWPITGEQHGCGDGKSIYKK